MTYFIKPLLLTLAGVVVMLCGAYGLDLTVEAAAWVNAAGVGAVGSLLITMAGAWFGLLGVAGVLSEI